MKTLGFPKPTKKKKRINLFPKEKTWWQLARELDKIISIRVRERDSWECVKCHKPFTPPTNELTCSHFWKREYKGTRWDLDNLDSLCWSCHQRAEKDKQGWYRDYMIEKLGEKKYQILEIRARSTTTFSRLDLQNLITINKHL